MKNQIILEYLEQLDLSDIEAKLYLTLLETGPISVRELAAKIDIKRTTAYLPIEQLIEKGLIMKVVKGANKLVAANDPKDSLEYLVKKKLQTAQSIEKNLPDMLKTLTTSIPEMKETGDAEIKYYKGRQGVKKIYEDALKANEIRSYVNIEEITEVFPENSSLFDTALQKNPKMNMYEIVENSPQAKKRFGTATKKERYFYKFLPEGMNLTAQDILIYDDNVAIIHFKDKISGVVLHNTDLYKNFKLLFDFIWKILPQ